MRITALSGGVGGARLLRGFASVAGIDLTAVVNVGDDETVYGLHLSPDLDTVTYTLAGVNSEDRGWGRADETWNVMEELGRFPIDSTFRLGDRDLAVNLYRTSRLFDGAALSTVTAEIARAFGVVPELLPVSDDRISTKVQSEGRWLDFQEYFVRLRHSVAVTDVRFAGVEDAAPAPGVLEALAECDVIVIGPSNPILSIWPILAVPDVRASLAGKRVMAVSPLIGGRAVKGPLAELLPAFGHSPSTAGIVESYGGLITDIVIHPGDEPRTDLGVRVHISDTRIADAHSARRLATEMSTWLS